MELQHLGVGPGVVRFGLVFALIDAVAPQQGLDPGAQLREGEGLGQIVVAARRQAQKLIGFLRFCGEKEDGDGGDLSYLLADPQAAHAGHHDVEDDQIDFRCEQAEGAGAVFGFEDAVALPGQKDAHAVPDVRVILYDHDGLHSL